jgi:hypothetical protein
MKHQLLFLIHVDDLRRNRISRRVLQWEPVDVCYCQIRQGFPTKLATGFAFLLPIPVILIVKVAVELMKN